MGRGGARPGAGRPALFGGNMTSQEFASYLHTLGWSQAEFCRRTGVAPNTVSRWNTGEIPKYPDWVRAYLNLATSVKGLAAQLDKGKP
jgi:transcriptional regulator with XRE-family HTH domain